jgi:hypothetical protein
MPTGKVGSVNMDLLILKRSLTAWSFISFDEAVPVMSKRPVLQLAISRFKARTKS